MKFQFVEKQGLGRTREFKPNHHSIEQAVKLG